MQTSTHLQIIQLETIHNQHLGRVVGGCGGHRQQQQASGAAAGGGPSGSPTGGMTSFDTGSTFSGGTSANPTGTTSVNYATPSGSGFGQLLQPLQALVQAIQTLEQSLGNGGNAGAGNFAAA
ncbi:MAG TPA: hypothetical protein VHW23_20900 [Kofleriaceae bacterium]|jgi:hypothetical protein|nr:hypothetical protein [Kofleriaceae bacterium]